MTLIGIEEHFLTAEIRDAADAIRAMTRTAASGLSFWMYSPISSSRRNALSVQRTRFRFMIEGRT